MRLAGGGDGEAAATHRLLLTCCLFFFTPCLLAGCLRPGQPTSWLTPALLMAALRWPTAGCGAPPLLPWAPCVAAYWPLSWRRRLRPPP